MKTHKVCSKCKTLKLLEEFTNDVRSSDGKVSACRECTSKYNSKYYQNNYTKITNRRIERKDEKQAYDVQYNRKRRGEDVEFRLADNIRRLIRKGVQKGYKEGSSTHIILGISHRGFLAHIESQFVEGMSWANMGRGKDKWHLDHIIPISSGASEEEKRKLSHYTNFQPLWERDNLRKSNKYKEADKRAYLEGLEAQFDTPKN